MKITNKKTIDITKILIFILVVIVFVFAIAFAVLSEEFKIINNNTIDAKWDISIVDVYSGDVEGIATNLFEPRKESELSASFGVNLIEKNDSITYTLVVKNKGTINAILSDIVVNTNGSNNIKYKIISVDEGVTRLNAGEKNIIKIIVYYDEMENSSNFVAETKKFNINLIYEQLKN